MEPIAGSKRRRTEFHGGRPGSRVLPICPVSLRSGYLAIAAVLTWPGSSRQKAILGPFVGSSIGSACDTWQMALR